MNKPFPVIQIAQIAEEMSASRLGDERLDNRAGTLVEMLAARPSASFPQAARDDSELQAFYRFLRMDSTGPGLVAAPHVQQTADRVEDLRHSKVFVAHDTTDLEVSDSFHPGLGPVNGEHGWGFLFHASMAIQADGPALPLGIISAQMWRRDLNGQDVADTEREPRKDPLPTMDNERVKWRRGVQSAEDQIEDDTELVHLMDRGADAYPLLARMVESDQTMVMRSNQNRRITDAIEGVDRPKIQDAFQEAPIRTERTISLSARDTTDRPPSAAPSREAREATVEIRATTVSIRRPGSCSATSPESVEVQVVWAREMDAPEGCEPVDWRLLTSQPVRTSDGAVDIIDQYCQRWVVEEFFGALKGPVRPEERQLKSGQTYSTALALMLPVAWRLLFLRTLAHHAPEIPATRELRPSQMGVLAADSNTDFDAPEGVTLREALNGIASMGGHLPRNGPPGWQVLHRGYQQLLLGEIRWIQGRQQLKKTIQDKWDAAEDTKEFGEWLEDLDMANRPLSYDQS